MEARYKNGHSSLAVQETSLVLAGKWGEMWVTAAFRDSRIDCSSKRRDHKSDIHKEEESSPLHVDD